MSITAADLVGHVVTLSATRGASQRTRNRIREHGPEFRAMAVEPTTFWEGPSLLVHAIGDDDWCGWIPLADLCAHVTITEE